ncbi:cation diffusion facilitator family transporter [Sandaracinobacter sp. RS1-74]|uniref:cation diffusion facilitator family transporter n=1 Tax=Sandaracinobacteroides sayramensis TaxID=2913411 RepID=UPI001EDA0432|nr:cation diffusion facilitator family transporter [Sandaracinobacteroides sayramensis]MCG2840329.1 cation diffusion facilitator family transporter [Sandaracinobacteroides sayramensis]
MGAIERATALKSELEASLLRLSIAATFLVSGLGVLFGLISGSLAILFDGMFSVVDAGATWLMLVVARLVARESNSKFQYGYWHLEPLVMALNSGVLMMLLLFGFLGAIQSLQTGGRTPELGPAVGYALLSAIISLGTWLWLSRQNERLNSALVRLDMKSWAMSGLMDAALLLTFVAALVMQYRGLERWLPYLDPAILVLISLLIFPMPWQDAKIAFRDIFQIVPPELDRHVQQVMQSFVERHGFQSYESYVTRTGRARFIEISVLAWPDMPPRSLEHFDDLRAEIGDAIGGGGPDRWLTIVFTADPTEL